MMEYSLAVAVAISLCTGGAGGIFIDVDRCGKPDPQYPIKTQNDTNHGERIVGGSEATAHSLPWQIYVDAGRGPRAYCGGSIVDNNWVLTAAHCTIGRRANDVSIRAGAHDKDEYSGTVQILRVTEIIQHPSYRNQSRHDNDISLLKLETPLRFNQYVKPICLYALNPTEKAGQYCIVSGWGFLGTSEWISQKLQQVYIPLITNEECRIQYEHVNKKITDSMICAGHPSGGIDACVNDSGGPLACRDGDRWYLAGIVSWGRGCAEPNFAGVYSRVFYFKDWIEQEIGVDKRVLICKNGGVGSRDGLWCDCKPGYTGINCDTDINECAKVTCNNRGKCYDEENSFTCVCDAGFSGDLCEIDIDECEKKPCYHGNCTDRINGFTCTCDPGYTGPYCADDINECATVTCNNRGKCIDGENSFTCVCDAGFSGDLCEIALPLTVPVQLSRFSAFTIQSPYDLTRYSIYIGLQGNSLLLGNTENNKLEKWELSLATDKVTQARRVWSAPMPWGMWVDCWKHETSKGDRIILQHGWRQIVLLDGATGREVRRWTMGDCWVIGVTSSHLGCRKGDKLHLQSMENYNQVVTLLSEGKYYSLCEEPLSGRIAVTDMWHDKLFIFSKDEQQLHAVLLTYVPAWPGAVVSVSPQLLAVLQQDRRNVSLHSWASGEWVQTVDIPLGEGELIHAMGAADRVLYLWVYRPGKAVQKIVSYMLI